MNPEQNQDPTPLVARIMAELRGNSEAEQMLLRAMLTNEFLGVPAGMYGIEKDVARITNRPVWTEANLDLLKETALENHVYRKARRLMSEALGVSARSCVQALAQEPSNDFLNEIGDAADDGRIAQWQESRVYDTDLIFHGLRRGDRTPVWIAVEASFTVRRWHIVNACASAAALQAVFGEEALAVAAGVRIDADDVEWAEAAGVTCLQVSLPRAA